MAAGKYHGISPIYGSYVVSDVGTKKEFGERYTNSNIRKKRNIMRKRGLLK